ncbi:TPA: hypothetical protein HA242_06565 [Candidatus Woesearchaeota archaeon]|nr:hypothetical protein [Candidatus Woesearchaeota archaeon]HIG93068.1 hypothetical protein [Candidatus Woesearchaeota archaeon]HIH13358.1 hypothetical protein [Candidatus Woesearchaeota archaeon]
MKTYHLAKDIFFRADSLNFKNRGSQILCSLQGEFLYQQQPYQPPAVYSMVDTPVMTQNVEDILYPVYINLIRDQHSARKT